MLVRAGEEFAAVRRHPGAGARGHPPDCQVGATPEAHSFQVIDLAIIAARRGNFRATYVVPMSEARIKEF